MTDQHGYSAKWSSLGTGLQFCELGVAATEGPLRSLHQPTVVRAQGRLLLCLSASSGIPPAAIDELLGQVAAELLDCSHGNEAAAILGALQEKLWSLFQDGRFDRAVPDIMAVVADGSRDVRLWRAGPNGVAIARKGGMSLVSEDLRIAALGRLGALLDARWSRDPLLAEVNELTQIEPPGSARQELVLDLQDGCLLLMSRGAMPFGAALAVEAINDWWGRDAGWRHGLGASVVAVASERTRSIGEDALFALARTIREARASIG